MPDFSTVEYAESSSGFVAYRTFGSGPTDLLLINDWFSHVGDLCRPDSPFLPILERLASFSRLILFDKRGVGMSDPLLSSDVPTLEEWADDVRAVLDAVGVERAAILGKGSGGTMATLFAASHPDRVTTIALINAWARLSRADDFPIGIPEAAQAQMLETPYMPPASVHAVAGETLRPQVIDWWQQYVRSAVSPRTSIAMRRWLFSVDVRAALPAVSCPTLVLSFLSSWIGPGHGRFLAEHIPHARLVELPGATDLLFAGDTETLVGHIEEFVTGHRRAPAADRVLATVLYTDIVNSTVEAERLGDRGWHELLDRHDRVVRDALAVGSGREVKTTGDGFVVTFDGPARAIRCAEAIRRDVRSLGLEVRAGLHAGEVEQRGAEIGGIAMHIGARVGALAQGGEILVSRTVRDLVAGSGIRFADRGTHILKGIEDEWQLYAVAD
jgi:pimeloyl-ACP methyl ester carboxylesterase